MKKKLSFLLALVFVMTLAFGALPGAGAAQQLPPTTDETLIITKCIDPTSSSYDPNQEFVITVSFTDNDNHDAPITSEMTEMAYVGPGTANLVGNSYQIKLSEATGLVGTFTKVRQRTSWTVVEEALPLGWQDEKYTDEENRGHDEYNDGRGQFLASGMTDRVTITNKFVQQYGQLRVQKNVSAGASTSKEFTINVNFTLGATGQLSDIKFDSKSANADYSGSDGVYTLTLADDEYVSFKNIPVGTTYTVSETVASKGWKGPSDITGTIDSTTPKCVTVENTYTPNGKLIVSKIVDTQGAPAATFPMTITFTPNNNLSNLITTATSTSTPGVYAFNLAAGGSIVFDNIPTGVSYEVKETITPYLQGMGWQAPTYEDNEVNVPDDVKNDGKGKIVNDGTTDTIIVHNSYKAPKVGTLTITKAIDTLKSDPFDVEQSPDFTIRVKFIGNYLDGIVPPAGSDKLLGTEPGTDIYDVKVKIGEANSVSFTNIPVGTKYEVSETEFPSTAWTLSTASDAIYNDDYADPYYTIDDLKEEVEIDVVTVKNVYTAPTVPEVPDSLIINKSTTGYQGSPVMFTIKVTFSLPQKYESISKLSIIDLNDFSNTAGEDGTGGVYTLHIAGGSSVTFSGIPDGVSYLVEEVSVPNNWTYMEASSTGLSGVIHAEDETTPHATVVNNYTPPVDNIQYGTLTVDKTAVSASTTAAIGTEPFAFTVTFTPNPWNVLGINNSLGLTGTNGVYTFTLTADAPAVVFSNIPTGTKYTVTEDAFSADQVTAGWVQGTVTGDTGTISTVGAIAAFENVLPVVESAKDSGSDNDDGSTDNAGQQVAGDVDTPLPQTGGISFSTLLGIFGLALIAAGGTAFTIFRKRNLGKSE